MIDFKPLILIPILLLSLISGHNFYNNQAVLSSVMFSIKIGRIGIFSQQIYYIEDINDVRKKLLAHFKSGEPLDMDPELTVKKNKMFFENVDINVGRKSDTLSIFLKDIKKENSKDIINYSLNSAETLVERHNKIISMFNLKEKNEVYTPTIISDIPRLISYRNFNSYPQIMLLSFVIGLILYLFILILSKKSEIDK